MDKKNKKLIMVCGVLMSLAVALHVFTGFMGDDELADETTQTQIESQNTTEKEEISDELIDVVIDPIIIPNGSIVNPPEMSEKPQTNTENNVIVDKDDFEIPPINIPQISIDKAQNIINNSNNETYSSDGLTIYQELQPTPTIPDGSSTNSNSSNGNNNNTNNDNNTNNNTNNNSSNSTNSNSNNDATQQNGNVNENGEIYVPGFGYTPVSGENTVTKAEDMWQNGNKVGIM